MMESGHEAFCVSKKWKKQKVSLELKRGYVNRWIWD